MADEKQEKTGKKEAEKVPVKKLHEHVIEKIQAADKISAEDKKIAVDEINRLKDLNMVQTPDFDKIDLNIGTPLGSLFAWGNSKVEDKMNFWNKINSSVSW